MTAREPLRIQRNLRAPSVDIYVTYRCNLRCKHCFVGEDLNSSMNMPFDMLKEIVEQAAAHWGTEEITFLGGEPTLYPWIDEAVKLVDALGMQPRIVTNGGRAFARFLRRESTELGLDRAPIYYFSIDGSTQETHDAIRGKGSFELLRSSIESARDLGRQTFGITSISTMNAHDVEGILRRCKEWGFEHVNVHRVAGRGFAEQNDIGIDVLDWLPIRDRVVRSALDLQIHARMDNSIAQHSEYTGYCSVRDNSSAMVLPDGRIFSCALFMDLSGAHGWSWVHGSLRENLASTSEHAVVSRGDTHACPAVQALEPDQLKSARADGRTVGCLYEKVDIDGGLVSLK